MEDDPEEWREVGGLRFSQVEISTCFSDNRHVMGMVKEWRENREKLEKGEVQLEVVELRNELIAVNNRRLFAAKVLKAMVGGEIWIPIRRSEDGGKIGEVRRRRTERTSLDMREEVIVTKVKKKGTETDRTLRYLEEGRSWTKELEPYFERMGRRERAT